MLNRSNYYLKLLRGISYINMIWNDPCRTDPEYEIFLFITCTRVAQVTYFIIVTKRKFTW